MNWIEIKISVHNDAVEAVSEIFYENGANGVSILGDIQMPDDENLYWDYIDESAVKTEESKVMAYFSEVEENLEEKIENIKKSVLNLKNFGLNVGSLDIETSTVNQEDWENSWKQYFKPFYVTDRIVVKPQWEDYEENSGDIVIQIDPGMAFGTGSHETTSMCIRNIEKFLKHDDSVLDIGTGSGILSIASAKLGAKRVVGVDLDPVAVTVAKENIELNQESEKIEVFHGNLLSTINGKYDIVVANIIAEAILILLESNVKDFVKSDGRFICSGIIAEKEDSVSKMLIEKGFEIEKTDRNGEWVCIVSKVKNG